VVAIDGPSSSGKSTVGAEAARRLHYRFCDTGLLYRAVTWLALERGVAATDTQAVVPLAAEVHLLADAQGRLRRVEADGRDVTTEVCGAPVDRSVSAYSMVPELRAALVARQRDIAAAGGIIMAGRDIGTVILPDADLKIFLDASAEERARRRAAERAAQDAMILKTDGRTFGQTVTAVLRAIRKAEKRVAGGVRPSVGGKAAGRTGRPE
jgi:cytidylate kinase